MIEGGEMIGTKAAPHTISIMKASRIYSIELKCSREVRSIEWDLLDTSLCSTFLQDSSLTRLSHSLSSLLSSQTISW